MVCLRDAAKRHFCTINFRRSLDDMTEKLNQFIRSFYFIFLHILPPILPLNLNRIVPRRRRKLSLSRPHEIVLSV